jgi:uncharacterized protein (UPF0248 family)
MGRRKGEIEEVLKRIFFAGKREDYIVLIIDRSPEGEALKPIPAASIEDIRGGYIYVKDNVIPFHRVVEVRDVKGNIIYSRKKVL